MVSIKKTVFFYKCFYVVRNVYKNNLLEREKGVFAHQIKDCLNFLKNTLKFSKSHLFYRMIENMLS